jgi:hypothetical protein
MQTMETPPEALVPLRATMETSMKWASGQVASSSSTFMRDEKGRTRVEQKEIASVSDPVEGKNFLLHPPKMIAIPQMPKAQMPKLPELPHKPSIAVPKVPGALPEMPQQPQFKEVADLGKKQIEGVTAHGKQYTATVPGKPQPMSMEVWTAPELKLPIHSTVHDPSSGTTVVTQMKNMTHGAKLDPAHFQIPPHFKIVPPSLPKPPKPPSIPKM